MRTFLSATRLASFWDRLNNSFWFLPSAMAAVATLLSFLLVQLDNWLGTQTVKDWSLLYTFGPEGARAILSTIASSMITVASLIFSITMLTLQLASSQFGPRLLRNFMRDRSNQMVLGTFVSTFLYCLLVLRTVRGTEDASFVPHLSVAFGVVLAAASLGVLIYFIHHIATSIRIETLLSQLAVETRAAIDRLYPERIGQEPPRGEDAAGQALPSAFESHARLIRADHSGYVQRIGMDSLMEIATEHDLVARIEARPGRFVKAGDAVFTVHPRDRISDETADALCGEIVIGPERTPEQDLAFSLWRIVEIAQRSLSPGINDPTTALYCIDRLGEALCRLAGRDLPSPRRFDESGQLRIVTEVDTLDAMARPAFAAIARYGITDADVVSRLLSTLDELGGKASPEARAAIIVLRDAIRHESLTQIELGFDRSSVLAPPDDGLPRE